MLEARPPAPSRRPRHAAGLWVRSSVASTCGTADCMPKEIRVKPASRRAASDAGVDAVRVGLGRHLGAGRQPELVADRGQHRGQVARRQQRRRAAADEHGRRRHAGVAEHLAGQPHLGDRGRA